MQKYIKGISLNMTTEFLNAQSKIDIYIYYVCIDFRLNIHAGLLLLKLDLCYIFKGPNYKFVFCFDQNSLPTRSK